jgi:hypothetical protein
LDEVFKYLTKVGEDNLRVLPLIKRVQIGLYRKIRENKNKVGVPVINARPFKGLKCLEKMSAKGLEKTWSKGLGNFSAVMLI